MVLCQACKDHENQVVLSDASKNPDKPYKLCQNCLGQLVNLSLTKKQYKNLLKSGHSPREFLIHDDFYDEDGKALQPHRFRS
jgi:hypothetical protein